MFLHLYLIGPISSDICQSLEFPELSILPTSDPQQTDLSILLEGEHHLYHGLSKAHEPMKLLIE